MIVVLSSIVLTAVALGFFYAAVTDFKFWKIYNSTVLMLIVGYAPYIFLTFQIRDIWPFPTHFLGAFGAACLLFAIGFVLWQFKLLGAGDAKLMFPIGLYIGWNNLLEFSLCLVFFAFIGTLLIKSPLPFGLSSSWPGMRLDEIKRTGKVPYGVIMVAAVYATMFFDYRS